MASSPKTAQSIDAGSTDAIAVLRRLGFGPRIGDIGWFNSLGLAGWLDEQLAPNAALDTDLTRRLNRLQLLIRYTAGPGTVAGNGVAQVWPAMDTQRTLQYLDAPLATAWKTADRGVAMDNAERRRPRDEVVAATMLRAVYSRWQLREVMVGFWHDHFNVDAYSGDQIAAALPVYDRDVIRPHALGNFREMLEAVAGSTAMQYYLSNRTSRAGSANENYARELFELHTLGRDAYLNDHYDRWREVPGATVGQPVGYIDQDVYEAARAFTGWTIEDGSRIDNHTQLPNSGHFTYVESWHDGYQKRVLATDFDPFQAPLADGRKVLDLVASHLATAHFVAGKLCQRILGDNPPARAVTAAAEVFHKNRNHDRQIALTVRAIVLAPEFAARSAKLQRPLAAMASFVRATGLEFTPSDGLANQLAGCGQKLFGWPTPNGAPDTDAYQLSANGLRQRWALLLGLGRNAWSNGMIPIGVLERFDAITPTAAARYWSTVFSGESDPAVQAGVVTALGWDPAKPVAPPGAQRQQRLMQVAAYCALAPALQWA